jgi:hypothetical protein
VAAFAGVAVCLMLARRTLIAMDPHRVAQPHPPRPPVDAPSLSGPRPPRGGDGGTGGGQPR